MVQSAQHASRSPSLAQSRRACLPAVQAAAAVASHAQALVALLDVGDDGAAQETPFGALRPPLGLARLKVMLPETTATSPQPLPY